VRQSSSRTENESRRLPDAILVINGPNLDRLGKRQPEIYGRATLADIERALHSRAEKLGVRIRAAQSNHEGELVELIGSAGDQGYAGILLNAAAYTHTSIAILDALLGSGLPCVEVHLSNPEAREPFRQTSVIARGCIGKVAGFGARSYTLALDALVAHLGGVGDSSPRRARHAR
jgi:3-dehydroquinate dehydratase II